MSEQHCPACGVRLGEWCPHSCTACEGIGYVYGSARPFLPGSAFGWCGRCYGIQLEPYYSDGERSIYHGDCRTILPLIQAKVDLVLTDPPYNVGKDFGNGTKADRRDDYIEWLNETWAACGGVVKDGGFLLYTNRIAHLPLGMMTIPEPWRLFHVMVWHKPLSLAGCWYSVAPHWEPIFVYLKGERPWRPFRSEFVMSDVRPHNIVTGKEHSHPTTKPVALMSDLIEFGSAAGDIVADPFLGSGTTLVAAKQLGRRGLGIEISVEHCATAAKRLEGLLPIVVPEGQVPLPLAPRSAEAGQVKLPEGTA